MSKFDTYFTNPKKNNEGYTDMTAYNAIKDIITEGEIYAYHDKQVLVVKNQGDYCNILTLCDTKNDYSCIEIKTSDGQVKYTAPAMLAYAFNNYLWDCKGKIADDEYDKVLEAVGEAMSVTLKKVEKVERPVAKPDRTAELQAKIELLQTMYNNLLNKVFEQNNAKGL